MNVFLRLVIFFIICFNIGCISEVNFSLSQEDRSLLIENSRQFTLHNLSSLNPHDICSINGNLPEISMYYLGGKSAQFFVSWTLSDSRKVHVRGMGYVDRKESIKGVSIYRNDRMLEDVVPK
jgi:hypothetical protein